MLRTWSVRKRAFNTPDCVYNGSTVGALLGRVDMSAISWQRFNESGLLEERFHLFCLTKCILPTGWLISEIFESWCPLANAAAR